MHDIYRERIRFYTDSTLRGFIIAFLACKIYYKTIDFEIEERTNSVPFSVAVIRRRYSLLLDYPTFFRTWFVKSLLRSNALALLIRHGIKNIIRKAEKK